jgi:hypothetical protein
VVSAGSYILSAALLVTLILSLGFSAFSLRRWLMPEWEGAPARLVEAIVGVALLIWLSELLGVFNLLYAGVLVAAAAVLAAAVAVGPRVLSRAGSPMCSDALRAPSAMGDPPGHATRGRGACAPRGGWHQIGDRTRRAESSVPCRHSCGCARLRALGADG